LPGDGRVKPLGKRTLREIELALHAYTLGKDFPGGTVTAEALLKEVRHALETKKSVRAHRVRTVAKRKTRKEEMAELREQVALRADGMCEACAVRGLEAVGTEMDHFFGGSGRRRALQSRFTCWLLCSGHHIEKTKGLPSVEHWLVRFMDHCNAKAADVEDHLFAKGYCDAAEMAQARLDSLTLQGRASPPQPLNKAGGQ